MESNSDNESKAESKEKPTNEIQMDTTMNSYFVYLLICSDGSASYVGATVDLDHRLRQHNGEIKGGAVATTSKLTKNRSWIRAAHVRGFPDWKSALQFEWRWKQISRKRLPKPNSIQQKRGPPLQNRLSALSELLSLERATTKATPYHLWPTPPEPVMETIEAQQLWTSMN
jgi:structure-specific endonuclease subunit SLX1